jgi:serine/threonine protein kinase/tetratricopeptide (TPR) repeat protein
MASKVESEQTWITTAEAEARTPLPSTTPSSREGTVLAGRYELLRLLGEGGMGAVYRARDRELDEIVALKILHSGVLKNPEVVARFKREVKLARRITHRNVARTFDLGEVDGTYYLTMEFIAGRGLTEEIDLIRGQGMDLKRFFLLAAQICDGLEAAHTAGVIHRDLKPDNILIEESERVALSDFGIARQHQSDGDLLKTAENTVLGTPAYMAPEQIDNKAVVDKRADIYALGAILFEMLTGSRAWVGDNFLTLTMARFLQPPPDPRERKAHVPDSLAHIVLQCMAKEAAGRFASATALANALQHAQQSIFPTTPTFSTRSFPPPSATEERTTVMSAFSSLPTPSPSTPSPASASLASSLFPSSAPSPVPVSLASLFPSSTASVSVAPISIAQTPSSSVVWKDTSPNAPSPAPASWTALAQPFASASPEALLSPSLLSTQIRNHAAPTQSEGLVLAVLPFRHSGPPEEEYLTEGFVEDLIDSLSMHRTLKVRPYSMVIPWKDATETHDVKGIGERLGVHKLIDGSVSLRGDALTLRVRLISVHDGTQIWAHRLQLDKGTLFQGVEQLTQLILEKMAVVCPPSEAPQRHQDFDPRAVEFYLRARQMLRKLWHQDMSPALELFEQARIFSPKDPLLLSSYAVGLARYAFFFREDLGPLQKAQIFVQQAAQIAPERAEIAFAQGMIHFVQDHFGQAIQYLQKAITQNSTFADAFDLLGRIKTEIGDIEEATQHLQWAAYLDPSIYGARVDLSRAYALLGRWEKVDTLWEQFLQPKPIHHTYFLHLERMNLWRPDPRDWDYGEIAQGNDFVIQGGMRLRNVRLRDAFPQEEFDQFVGIIQSFPSARFRRLLAQQMVEILCYVQDYPRALDFVRYTVGEGLTDLHWFSGCPLLEPLWSEPEFVDLHAKVQARVQKALQIA